jgi:hypothetical protein
MIRPAVLLFSCVLLLLSAPSAMGQTNTRTLNGRDVVQIYRITPRTDAEIPLPANDFVFSMEIQSRMLTAPRGTITVNFYRYSKKSMQLVRVAPPLRKSIPGGAGIQRWVVHSAPFTIASAGPDEMLYTKAYLTNPHGKVVAWSNSLNPLRGRVVIRPNATRASRDLVRALSGTTPPLTALTAGGTATFVLHLRYEVKSSPRGVINVEFGQLTDVRLGTPWSVSVVEVPAGTGELEIRRSFALSAYMKGTRLAIGVGLRNDPLSGASSHFELQPYPIGL